MFICIAYVTVSSFEIFVKICFGITIVAFTWWYTLDYAIDKCRMLTWETWRYRRNVYTFVNFMIQYLAVRTTYYCRSLMYYLHNMKTFWIVHNRIGRNIYRYRHDFTPVAKSVYNESAFENLSRSFLAQECVLRRRQCRNKHDAWKIIFCRVNASW